MTLSGLCSKICKTVVRRNRIPMTDIRPKRILGLVILNSDGSAPRSPLTPRLEAAASRTTCRWSVFALPTPAPPKNRMTAGIYRGGSTKTCSAGLDFSQNPSMLQEWADIARANKHTRNGASPFSTEIPS